MLASNILFALSALLATSMAAPAAEAAPIADTLESKVVDFAEPLAKRSDAIVTTYSGDSCNGGNEQFTVVGGGYRCVPVSNKRSISLSGSGCAVNTWSGGNCQGSRAGITYGRCTSVLYGSVSVQC